tara:strand:+ start:3367 stop:4020 length:654 start_codon:yes stop_codon:yes gene_type:complete
MKTILIIFLSLLCSTSLLANRFFQPQPQDLFIVDDFEDSDLYLNPKWWIFDNLNLSIKGNNENEFKYLGKKSVQLTGNPKRWYVGGCGTYFGIDAEPYNALKLVVRGYGPDSGILIIELFDDDNGNWEIEPHTDIESETLADDKFIHTLKVDWIGWKVIILPFSKFVDGNIDIGDDRWNPNQKKGSGGLIQMQLVLLASNKKEKPMVRIDTIKIFNK